MTEIHRVSIQLRRPMGQDPGAVEACGYIIEGGDTVVLTGSRDPTPLVREGAARSRRRGEPEPLLRWERKLRPGEDAGRAARGLLLQKHSAQKKGSDFNRPLRYPGSGGVV